MVYRRYQVVKMEVFVPDHGHIKRREYCESIRVGMLYSPHKGILPKCRHYIIDNGAYRAWIKGEKTNGNEFFAYLGKVMKCIYPQPYFVVIPDIVAGGMESFEYSISCIGKIPEDMPRYFVVQDGMYPQTVEEIITAVDGLFVGGTTVWKWRTAHSWVDLAHRYGKKCHIGRVGTWRNFLRAYSLGADSVDGSNLMRNRKLERIALWREELKNQRILDKEDWMMSVGAAVYASLR